jgi:hypothetical protein
MFLIAAGHYVGHWPRAYPPCVYGSEKTAGQILILKK